jgi:hypothetical protein
VSKLSQPDISGLVVGRLNPDRDDVDCDNILELQAAGSYGVLVNVNTMSPPWWQTIKRIVVSG